MNPLIEKVIAEKVRLAFHAEVCLQGAETLTADAIEDTTLRLEYMVRTQAYRLTAMRYVLAVGQEKHCYPANWWEALKQRFAPQWALRRWPVRWTEFPTWERVCPHHSSPHSGKKHVEWLAGYSAEEMF